MCFCIPRTLNPPSFPHFPPISAPIRRRKPTIGSSEAQLGYVVERPQAAGVCHRSAGDEFLPADDLLHGDLDLYFCFFFAPDFYKEK
ncbi:MAG: hypothetical protein BJ554DRAFT_3527 [Olpidium bornovanus]|uniref:Uncharacterized protein n=1 Tax=Olpidium bornovanus TaxID=278681 RepID=A0A8H8DG61_9FUNG|nr:MAG: hypothetical protein BJ554DRAFT_3527 [Olpidium bornovanus]